MSPCEKISRARPVLIEASMMKLRGYAGSGKISPRRKWKCHKNRLEGRVSRWRLKESHFFGTNIICKEAYSNCRDVLLGLNNITGKPAFDRVLGRNKILRKSQTTVILATHSTHRVRQADKAVVMSSGRTIEQDEYRKVLAGNLDSHIFKTGASTEINTESNLKNEKPTSTETAKPGSLTKANSGSGDNDDTYDRRLGNIRFLYVLSAVGKWHCGICLVLLVLSTAYTTLQYIWLKWWVEFDGSGRSSTMKNLLVVETSLDAIIHIHQLADTPAEENRSAISDLLKGGPLVGSARFKGLAASCREFGIPVLCGGNLNIGPAEK
ncbi:hypothetical protein AOQ84DRAFT_436584 [Glonium stellatum]|uniref:Uncharacterized protein n=1 Tax=Glonium stellatum TaxID=574774 RepID=A0A8E2FA15_9PEZI|nr:hypothetical protein AOQ84DRAFT_436584 [Glonium stellatum]